MVPRLLLWLMSSQGAEAGRVSGLERGVSGPATASPFLSSVWSPLGTGWHPFTFDRQRVSESFLTIRESRGPAARH